MKDSKDLADFGAGIAFALPFIVAAGLIYLAWHLMLYLLELLLLLLTPPAP
jgi:hypothetical protein